MQRQPLKTNLHVFRQNKFDSLPQKTLEAHNLGMLISILFFLNFNSALAQTPSHEAFTNTFARPKATQYRIYLADVDNRKKQFRVDVTSNFNPRGYRMFESYIKNGIKLDPKGNPKIGLVIGEITQTKPSKLHHFNFRFISHTVRWNDFATEACDGRLQDVETNLEDWLKLGQFCPWTTGSMIVRIVKNNKVIWKRPETN